MCRCSLWATATRLRTKSGYRRGHQGWVKRVCHPHFCFSQARQKLKAGGNNPNWLKRRVKTYIERVGKEVHVTYGYCTVLPCNRHCVAVITGLLGYFMVLFLSRSNLATDPFVRSAPAGMGVNRARLTIWAASCSSISAAPSRRVICIAFLWLNGGAETQPMLVKAHGGRLMRWASVSSVFR